MGHWTVRSLSLVLLALSLARPGGAQQQDIEKALGLIPEVSYEAVEPPEGFTASFELRVRQLVDHDDPAQGAFLQRVFFNYRDAHRPTVLVTNGYSRANNRPTELSRYLEANEVSVEHRYFGASVPDSLDWSFLTLQQATADLHSVRWLLGDVLSGPWVSSGRSKGGMTTIAYRYFYPDDVSASVPYVAPLQTSLEDQRIYAFLGSAGTPECRRNQEHFQRFMLDERDEVLPRLKWFAKGKGWTFQYMGLEAALEYAVLEYPFSFWQYGWDCGAIPAMGTGDVEAAVDQGLEYLDAVVGLSMYSDQSLEQYGPHFYQAATQTGYYGFETEPFLGLLEALPAEPNAAFVPQDLEATYDPTLLIQISEWVKVEARNFILLYGEVDTWTAAAAEISPESNSIKLVLPGRHHGDATIENLSDENRERVRSALEEWLGMALDAELWAGR